MVVPLTIMPTLRRVSLVDCFASEVRITLGLKSTKLVKINRNRKGLIFMAILFKY
jgi:hypothetical protein